MVRNDVVGKFVLASIVLIACMPAHAIERGRQSGGREGEQRQSGERQSPGGSWGERSHQAGTTHHQHQYSQQGEQRSTERSGDREGFNGRTPQNSRDESSSAFEKRNNSTTSAGKDAAAGAAAANRRSPQYSGAEGAAAGAAAANRRQPQYSGKEGAAAGAAVANRNAPQFSGAQGAAAGAAAANRNAPKYSGAQGAAAGAAVANRNQPNMSGAQGAALGAAAANRNAPQFSGAAGAVAGSAAVRNSFNNYGLYGQQWNASNPGVWTTGNWASGNAWTPTNWAGVSSFVGSNNQPNWYDYGTNVTNQNGTITMNGQNVGTAEQFSQQAADLAQAGTAANTSPDDQWMPLGVFAMVRNEQQHPQMVMQLAVNKQGVLRGNFTDEVTEHTQPIHGSADPKTQRAAWIVGNSTAIMETGLSNLADGEAPALIHKNGKTDHWLLVRLEQPPGQNGDGAAGSASPASQ